MSLTDVSKARLLIPANASSRFFLGDVECLRWSCKHLSLCSPSSSFLRCESKVRTQEHERKGTRQRAAKQERRRLYLEGYRSRFSAALEAELAEEMLAVKERWKNWSKTRLLDEGMALFDLSVRLDGTLFRDKILRFYRAQGDGLLPVHHQFSQGDLVSICTEDPLKEEGSLIDGFVMERARRFLKVAVSAGQYKQIDTKLSWRLDLSANQVSFARCMWAVTAFSSPLVRQGFQPPALGTKINLKSVVPGIMINTDPVFGEAVLSFRDMILQHEHLSGKNELSHIDSGEAVSVMGSPPSRIEELQLGTQRGLIAASVKGMDLNDSQKEAIRKAMVRRLTLWQGPPGTGKTRTLVHFIKSYCQLKRGQVLACADSNVAVDNMVKGLLLQGLRVVRVGQPVKVKEELREVTLAAQVAAHPLMHKVQALREASRTSQHVSRFITSEKMRGASATQAAGLWERSIDLEKQAIQAVLDGADVVLSTCVGAGDMVLDGRRFHACVIDEASQATEPATLIPILRSGAETVLLVGDPAQLPPTVVSTDAIEAGLMRTLFERLQECGVQPLLLDTQYRMHPVLAAWPSKVFYGDRLKSSVSPSERLTPKGLDWPSKEKPLMFIECGDGVEEIRGLGTSWFNRLEAVQVLQVVQSLIASDKNLPVSEIGVISPYNAQVRFINELISRPEAAAFADLEAKTVDGFQGREKEVIIISTVRANPYGNLGFVDDPRRMNVAMTRAKRGLVVVGNIRTLSSSFYWSKWMDMMKKNKLIVS